MQARKAMKWEKFVRLTLSILFLAFWWWCCCCFYCFYCVIIWYNYLMNKIKSKTKIDKEGQRGNKIHVKRITLQKWISPNPFSKYTHEKNENEQQQQKTEHKKVNSIGWERTWSSVYVFNILHSRKCWCCARSSVHLFAWLKIETNSIFRP